MLNRQVFLHPRDQLLDSIERIYQYRMTTTSGGNLSLHDTRDDIWITPARVDKGSLTRDDMVCLRHDGAVEGRHPPSSELPFHQQIYAARPDLRAIVHAHPVALVAFSICRLAPNTCLLHQARRVCGEVGFAPYALPGSQQLGKNIAAQFAAGHNCVMLENHGVVVAGRDMSEAFQRFETLEFTAKTIIKATALGKLRYLDDQQLALPPQGALKLAEFYRPMPTSGENELRRNLRDFVRRGYRQRLFISTEGTFSARVDADKFLITPYQIDRARIDIDDLVLVSHSQREADRWPSRATLIHQAVYDRYPEIQSIVNGYPVNATAFSVTPTQLESRTIPESYLFLRDVQRVPFGLQFSAPEQVAAAVSPTRPIALLENDGVLVLGRTVLDAFDRLEVLESTAEALVNGRALGPVTPMNEAVIAELLAHFCPNESHE
ncbi:MAG: class II aldolase/adducin family protein [Planctomycetes bacterium]|nr:class II aldolase/adducin family protein [Planctomycetota bacterium]